MPVPNPTPSPAGSVDEETWTIYRFTKFAGRPTKTDWQVVPPDRSLNGYDGDEIESIEVCRASQLHSLRADLKRVEAENERLVSEEEDQRARAEAAEQQVQALTEALERIASMGDRVDRSVPGDPIIVLCHPRELEDAAAIARSALSSTSPTGESS
jgi:hypothetical protein